MKTDGVLGPQRTPRRPASEICLTRLVRGHSKPSRINSDKLRWQCTYCAQIPMRVTRFPPILFPLSQSTSMTFRSGGRGAPGWSPRDDVRAFSCLMRTACSCSCTNSAASGGQADILHTHTHTGLQRGKQAYYTYI